MTVAVGKGTSLAAEKGPAVWLRHGRPRAHGGHDEVARLSGGGLGFRGFRLLGAVGPALELEDDGTLDQAVEESHCQRTVSEIVSPLIEVDVGDQRRGALLIP